MAGYPYAGRKLTETELDRRRALRAASPDEIAYLFDQIPFLADAAEGAGPLAPTMRGAYPTPGRPEHKAQLSLDDLARVLALGSTISITIGTLRAFDRQLLDVAVWHGGSVTREEALAEAGGAASGDELDAAADRLAGVLLTDRSRGYVAVRVGVRRAVVLPGIPLREVMQHQSYTSDALAAQLKRLDIKPPAKKMQRVGALEAAMRDPERVRFLVSQLSPAAREAFELLAAEGPQLVEALGVPYYSPWNTHRSTGGVPLFELLDAGLVGADPGSQRCFLWLDVLVGLRGRLWPDWDLPTGLPPSEPLVDRRGGFPPALARLTGLLDLWRREPVAALQTGGIGVRPMRAAAKALGAPVTEIGLLVHLAVELGLLGTVMTGMSGRGRNRRGQVEWQPTALAEEWSARPPGERWLLLVQAWSELATVDEEEGLPERWDKPSHHLWPAFARALLLRLLGELPPGEGIVEDQLGHLAGNRHIMLDGPAGERTAAAARALGLVAGSGPVGLTDLGRAVLSGTDALREATGDEANQFTVQADHTVICPPDLAADVLVGVERVAELESDAGARVYRLSEARIARAIDAGDTAAVLLEFLAEHSPTGVPQNVAHLVEDCERRHGQLRVGKANAYLRCDDPALLARAATIKAAKLTLLAPTVAVSDLTPTALRAALGKKDLIAVTEDDEGGAPDAVGAAQPARWGATALPEIRPRSPRDAAELRRIAKRLKDRTGPDDSPPTRTPADDPRESVPVTGHLRLVTSGPEGPDDIDLWLEPEDEDDWP